MNETAKVATAVVGGYVLGRTKKAKTALALGMWLAGRKMRTRPSWLVADALGKLAGSEPGQQLRQQLTGEVLGRGRRVVGGMMTDQLERLAEGLVDRADILSNGGGNHSDGKAGRRGRAQDRDDREQDDREQDEYESDEYEQDDEPDEYESDEYESDSESDDESDDEYDEEPRDDYEDEESDDDESDDDESDEDYDEEPRDDYEDEDEYDDEPEPEPEPVGAHGGRRRAGSRARR